jgi:hypothetical protein
MNKIQGFYSKLKFWLQLTVCGYNEMFPIVFSFGAKKKKKDITLCQQTTFKYYGASFHITFKAVLKILIMFNT